MKFRTSPLHYREIFAMSLLALLLVATNAAYAQKTTENELKVTKLLAEDGRSHDFFGYDVSISGNTALVGAYRVDTNKGEDAGAAYIYTENDGKWAQQAKLVPSDGEAQDTFGGKVTLSGDTAIIGVIRDDDQVHGEDVGSAYVFKRQGKQWHQQAKLVPDDANAGDSFGWSIGISGETAVIGAPHDDDKGTSSGSAYVFTRYGNTWIQEQKLTASDGTEGDVFGISAAISGDTLIVGADLNEEKGANAGAVYVFTRKDDRWHQQAKLTAEDGAAGDIFGVRVALENDTAVISARRDDDEVMGKDAGSVYIFTRHNNKWQQQTKLTAPDGAADDRFGRSVALAGDTVLIGAMFQDNKGENSGSAYLYQRKGNGWHLLKQLTADDGESGDVFGWSVALDDQQAIISANRDNDQGENAGAVYIYSLDNQKH